MTKKEAERRAAQAEALRGLGFTADEADALRRISVTLSRWHEMECGINGGSVVRNPDTGKPFWQTAYPYSITPIADRGKGARKRLAAIMGAHPELSAYVQTDPRGAALYILRPGDVPEGKDVAAYYTRGVCVY